MAGQNLVLPLTPTAVSLLEEYKESPKVRAQYEISDQENVNTPFSLSDPIGDEPHTVTKGLVHRYKNRVLLKITDQCAAYCRFCFRKDMLNKGESVLKRTDIDKAITYIKNHSEIEEVILSGGDPFILSNRRLDELLQRLTNIYHITKIRFHTRMPVMRPSRIDQELCAILSELKQDVRVVLHINHADELTPSRSKAIQRLGRANIELMSQSVLLKNINNTVEELDSLFNGLTKLNVRPYYLHHLDKAYGTDHFRVSIEEGQNLMAAIKKLKPNYVIPDYMIDIPSGFGKRSLLSNNVHRIDQHNYRLTDKDGINHNYLDEAA